MMTTTTMMVLPALEGALVLAVAGLLALLRGRASASLRHLIWTGGLAVALSLPLLQGFGPRVQVPVPPSWLGEGSPAATGASARHQETLVSVAGPARVAPASQRRSGAGGLDAASAAALEPVAAAVAEKSGLAREPRRRGTAREARAFDTSGSTVPWNWTGLGVSIWLLGVVLLLSGVLFSHLAAFAVVRSGIEQAPPAIRGRARALARSLGLRGPVRVVVSSRIRVPATWGLWRPTVVLPAGHVRWRPGMIDRVLLHELAHVQRRDCLARLVGEVARAVHWPNPLAWIAVRRQRVESELACDDLVVTSGGRASAYAQDLVGLVRSLQRGGVLPGAVLAMARSSDVGGRVQAILDPRRTRTRVGRVGVAFAGLTAAAVALSLTGLTPVARAQDPPPAPAAAPRVIEVVPAAPVGAALEASSERPPAPPEALPAVEAPSQELCGVASGGRRSTNIQIDDDHARIRVETDSCRLDVEIEGRVDFATDDADVVAMGSGATFEIEQRMDGVRRRALLEGGGGGRIDRRYWVDGDEVAWGAEAQSWLAQTLPDLFRHTTINAEARVARLLDEGGPDRVFQEVARIGSDHVATRYLELLMEQASLTVAEYTRVIEAAGRLESDHNAATLLLAVVDEAGLDPAFQAPMLRAAESIESDHQKTGVLRALLEAELSPEQLDAVVRSAMTIESDHNLAQILSTVARQGRLDATGRSAFIEALGSLESDHQHATVVHAFLDTGRLPGEELASVLALTRGIESDHQRASVLERVGSEYDLTAGQITAYLESAAELDSDHQTATVALALLQRSDVTTEQLLMVMDIADGIDSDHQRAQVLTAVIDRRVLSATEIDALIRVANGLDSDHQLASTLVSLATDEELSPRAVYDLIQTASSIGSDHQQAQVLVSVAENHPVEGDALERYRSLAEDMSRHQRDTVLAALVR